jgi:hypothetical protein
MEDNFEYFMVQEPTDEACLAKVKELRVEGWEVAGPVLVTGKPEVVMQPMLRRKPNESN